MKIVCDSCSAKYSIADEKVAGKVFKIRCKKCSNVIVVRGDHVEAGSAHDEAPSAFDYGADAVWHLVLDGEQQGPFTAAQVAGMLAEGNIDYESYVWKEGFDGWKTLSDVPELMSAVGGADGAGDGSMNVDSDSGAGSADPFAASASAGGLFASSSTGGGANANDLFASSSGGNLFDSGDSDDVVASKPSPRVSTSEAMTGQRNENSVLFSLSNLQALASSSDTGPKGGGALRGASPSPRGGFPAAAGMAAGEGSGLIDIRALASATAAATSPASRKSAGSPVDDLLSIGVGPSLGSALGAPVLAPVAPEPVAAQAAVQQGGGSNKLVLIAAAVVVLAALAAVAYAFTRPPAVQVVTQPPVTPTANPAPGDPLGAPPAIPDPAGTATPPGSAPAAPSGTVPVEPTAGTGSETQSSSSSAGRRPSSTGSTSTTTSTARPADPSTLATTASVTTMQSTSTPPTTTMESTMAPTLDDLIGMAVAPMTEDTADLPDTPSRSAVSSALGGRAAAVRACGNGATGTATVAVTFASNGRVTSANVAGGSFAGNSCIANAVRGARVPPFRQPSFNVNFPYRL